MDIQKQQLGYIEGWLSTVLNTLLFGLKLWVGIRAGSVAMVADAWHTLSDTLTSIVVIFGFWIAGKPQDREHPFGHGRAEVIGAVVIGTLLAVVGFNFLVKSYHQLRNPQHVNFSLFSIVVFAISIVLKEALAQFSLWAGKKVKSQSLIADGWHHRSDAIASALIVIGALFGKTFWWIDGVLQHYSLLLNW
jgi:cation diffusion facilitator family transporter